MAKGAAAECAVQQGRELLVIIDNESEPGSWDREMRRAPWAFGQTPREPDIAEIIGKMRAHGLDREADVIARLLLETKVASAGKT